MSVTVEELDGFDAEEHAVLCEAVADIERWITELPASSAGWRMAFLSARREIAAAAGLRLVAPVQSLPDEPSFRSAAG